MSNPTTTHTSTTNVSSVDANHSHALEHQTRRLTTETKASFKTTELIVYVLAVIGVLIAALVTDSNDDGQAFSASRAWLYVTLLTIGYMVSRGLAKSGSREAYDA